MKLFVLSLCAVAAMAMPAMDEKIIDIRPRVPANPDYIPPTLGRIVGGEEAFANSTYHQFPHATHLHYSTSFGGFYCTAQVIHEKWIMTAGHCCDNNADNQAPNYKLVAGAHNRQPNANDDADKNSKVYIDGVKRVIQHERYYPAVIANDICLLELNQNLVFQANLLQPAVLATDATSVADKNGSEVFPCGWGRTSDTSGSIPNLLQWTMDYTETDEKCKSIFNIEYGPGEICIDTTITNNTGTCSGDSGGPLNIPNPDFDSSYDPNAQGNSPANTKAIRWVTNGITSYGASAGCQKGYPDAFTDVNFYNGGTSAGVKGEDWIKTNTGGDVGGQPAKKK